MLTLQDFKKINDYLWEIPKEHRPGMLVPARIYIDRKMLEPILEERAVEQLINVATLPGIEGYALAMPDIHQGYGFPIGGVAAIRAEDGVISPGGVGYDINCGVRLLLSEFHLSDLRDKIVAFANQIQRDIPSGVGRGGSMVLGEKEMDKVLEQGVKWAFEKGYADEADMEKIEEGGYFKAADSFCVSSRAKKRGADQLGTLGAGNHFLEIQEVEKIFDETVAGKFGLFAGQVAVMIHTGSRGLGHQVCTDYVRLMDGAMAKYGIKLPDRELACAPFKSEEGQKYFRAMAAAANFAWANRQMITYYVRQAWNRVIVEMRRGASLRLLYDVAHNIAKVEKYPQTPLTPLMQGGRKENTPFNKGGQRVILPPLLNKERVGGEVFVEYIIHRKGATRAFGPNSSELPVIYRETGQPVIIPGSMGTASYVLVGTEMAMKETYGSTCHGAGRRMSRMRSKKALSLENLKKELEEKGVVVRGGSARGLLEEAPESYKDIEEVVGVVHGAGIARKVAKLRPLAVIKG